MLMMTSAAAAEMAMDVLTVMIALRLRGSRIAPARVLAAALLGTAAAFCIRRLGWGAGPPVWFGVALCMMLAADSRAARSPLRSAAALLAAAGLLGGTVHALAAALGSREAAWLLGAGFSLAAAGMGRRRRARWRGEMILLAGGRRVRFAAVEDSGNTLRDYLSRRAVIVLPQEDADRLLGRVAARPIFADTAGGRQMMWCFLPQRTWLCAGLHRRRVDAAIAVSPGLAAGTPALVPAALLGETS